jgi:hypothetical protein
MQQTTSLLPFLLVVIGAGVVVVVVVVVGVVVGVGVGVDVGVGVGVDVGVVAAVPKATSHDLAASEMRICRMASKLLAK